MHHPPADPPASSGGGAPTRTPSLPALVLLALLLTGPALFGTPGAATAQVPDDARTEEGLFTVHRTDDRILFEIPDALLGRDMAVMSRFAQAQEGLASGGDRMAPNMVVRWEEREGRILLRAVSHSDSAEEDTPLHLAVGGGSGVCV